MNKAKTFDSSCFIGKIYFEEDGTQNNLVFQPILKYFKREKNTDYILEWKSKGISDEAFKIPIVTENILKPLLAYGNKIKAKFIGSCLKQEKVTYNHKKL